MRIEIIYKLVTWVIPYFCFLDKPMKTWGHLGFLERRVGLEKGCVTPITNYGHEI